MGATDISFVVKGDVSKEEVTKAFKDRQARDRDYNGHQEGYSGDFQTVNSVRFVDQIFEDENKAYDYCLDNAQKWEYVIAARFKKDNEINWLVAGWGAE